LLQRIDISRQQSLSERATIGTIRWNRPSRDSPSFARFVPSPVCGMKCDSAAWIDMPINVVYLLYRQDFGSGRAIR
jgi:hypothetical protein